MFQGMIAIEPLQYVRLEAVSPPLLMDAPKNGVTNDVACIETPVRRAYLRIGGSSDRRQTRLPAVEQALQTTGQHCV
jgi:hypothetical protein